MGWDGGSMHVDVYRGEVNDTEPVFQLMLGLWWANQGNPRTTGKWASVTS